MIVGYQPWPVQLIFTFFSQKAKHEIDTSRVSVEKQKNWRGFPISPQPLQKPRDSGVFCFWS